MQRAWQHTLGHKDELKSGTAATVIELEDVPPGALLSEPFAQNIAEKARSKLTVKQLYDDIDWPHVRGIGAASILRIWLKYVPSLSPHRAAVEELFTVKHNKHRLRLRKSKIHTLRATNINESTTVGAASVLRNLLAQLFITPVSLVNWMFMLCGDQLTIDRIRKIIRYTAKCDTPHEQHKWALPIIQLWHMKWAWQKAIFRLHWHSDLAKGTFGLHHDIVLIERENSIYGEPWSGEVVPEETESATPAPVRLAKKKKRSRTTAAAQPARNFSNGDQALVTLCNFMRVTLWYMELCASIAKGDIGRSFEVIKLLRFSFWGAGSTNYGNELLELACNSLYEFSEDLKTAVLNNYLANPSGRIGHWLELDLLQEHFNFWIKRLFNAKSHDLEGQHLAEAVNLNIAGISKLRETFPGLFGLKRNGQRHTDASTIHDINQLGNHFRKNHVLEYEGGRNQPYVVPNEWGLGYAKLLNGQLKTFLDRTTGGQSVAADEPEPVLSADPGFSAAPVTVSKGILDVGEFITGG
ncbi:hypothetical protein R3P38DRAFT_3227090 [Favolaschia claudopus]|uniref:DUF6589 domain-containing protein n=1 Tax=Favolaschia claudopus TaxID=2862362 RepID=A0AAV9ZTI9_9AGAR